MTQLEQVLRAQSKALQSLTTIHLFANAIGNKGLAHISQALRAQPISFTIINCIKS